MEFELVIKNLLPIKKSQGHEGFLVKSTKGMNNSQASQTISKLEDEGIFSNLFYEASITLVLKPNKDITKNIPYKYKHKYPQQNISRLNPAIHKKAYSP